MSESSENPPGWDAITNAATLVYGDQRPMHLSPQISFAMGGSDPLDGISAYRSEKQHTHWHFITYGMTELYDKISEDPTHSGFGYEFTFRLRVKETKTPPSWVPQFLNNLANHSFQTGRVFGNGAYLDLNGPIAFGKETEITAIVFANDPELKPLNTPNGKVEFLQIIGITHDELSAIKRWNSLGFIELMQQQNPLLITSIKRTSILQDPATKRALDEGSRREGSFTEALSSAYIHWNQSLDKYNIVIDARTVLSLRDLLPLRLPYGKDLTVLRHGSVVVFRSGTNPGIESRDETVTITMTSEQAQQLSQAVQPKEGSYEIPGIANAALHVCKFEITDHAGNVIESIG